MYMGTNGFVHSEQRQNVSLYRVGEAILFYGWDAIVCRVLHLFGGIAHSDAESGGLH